MTSQDIWKDKKVLIAGGRGFIGFNFAIKLKKLGAIVTITEHQNVNEKQPYKDTSDFDVVPCDLLRQQDCEYVTQDKEIVFMCAAISHGAKFIKENPLAMVTPNVIMNCQMIDACYKNNVKKFVFISSSAAYPNTQEIPTKESDMFKGDPYSVYYAPAWMKRYTEILCRTYTEKIENKMQCVVIRPSNIYGPHDTYDKDLSHVTAALIRKVAEHQNPLEVWGTGEDIRDILYIEDFVEMSLDAISKIEGFEPINIGYGDTCSVKQILEMLCKLENFSPEIIYNVNKPSMIPIRKINTKKAKTLKIVPKFTMYEGLDKTLTWYKESINNDTSKNTL